MKRQVCLWAVLILALTGVSSAQSNAALSADDQQKIDGIVTQTLASTGAPSASIAIVKNGQIVYAHAYGDANIEAKTPAKPEMRYCIGSISKQFTASAILLLAEQGKLSLEDPVSKYVPKLTRGNEVTIREILSMTSGYQDFWPQDYVMPLMMKPASPQYILDHWARIPLDFEPGMKWQYSNTNYVIAGQIIEKVSGMPMLDFVKKNILTPLHMESAESMHLAKNDPKEPVGYLKYALGPPRPAPKEGNGWMYAAGELSMTASDLAKWDISVMDQKVLKPASYKQLETEVLLKNGAGTNYALGIGVDVQQGRRMLSHGGEVSGFVSNNVVYPDDRAAVVVLTNLDASAAAGQIARKISPLLFTTADKKAEEELQRMRKIFDGLQHGQIDRSLFTDNCNSYFDEQALKDFAGSLGPLGTPVDFRQGSHSLRGGMDFRSYTVKFENGKTVRVTTFIMPDGKIEQYLVMAAE